MTKLKINKNSKVPLYLQIREKLKDLIINDYFEKNDIPLTEKYLQEEFRVSRNTIRSALADLEKQGFLLRVRSRGISIIKETSPAVQESISGLSFTESVIQKGQIPKSKLLDFQIIKAPVDKAAALSIKEGELIFYIRRLRYLEDTPIWLVDSYIPVNKVPNLKEEDFTETGWRQSLFNVLENTHGLSIHMWIESIRVIMLPKEICKLLQIDNNLPGLFRKDKIYVKEGTIIAYNESKLTSEYEIQGLTYKREKYTDFEWPQEGAEGKKI